MILPLSTCCLGILASTALGAAIAAAHDPEGAHYECGTYGDDGACSEWVAMGACLVTFEALNTTVVVPSGTKFTPETGIDFDYVSTLPGAMVQDGLTKAHLTKRANKCKNSQPIGDNNTKWKHCRADRAVKPGFGEWRYGAHNCKKYKGGKYYLCCVDNFCPAWRVGRFGGCMQPLLNCECKAIDEWMGWENGQCFT